MHLRRATIILFCTLIFLSYIPINSTAEDNTIKAYVNATFEINIVTGTEFDITVSMDVNQIEIFGDIYYNNQIATLAASNDKNDTETIGAIKYLLDQQLDNQINQNFKNSDVLATTSRPDYSGGSFVSRYGVNLLSSFFDMENNINVYNLINGVLDMGAYVNYSIPFYAETGWNNTYIINFGTDYNFQSTDGNPNGKIIEWIQKNSDGNNQIKDAKFKLKKENPTTPNIKSEDIFIEFELDSRIPKTTSLTANLLLNAIDISIYNILPDCISNLKYVNSDGLRLFIENNLTTWNNSYSTTISPLEEIIKTTIENSIFNQTIDFTFNWDDDTTTDLSEPYNISKMNSDPEIKAMLTDPQVNLLIHSITNRAVFGLVNSGAFVNISKDDINFGDSLELIGREYSITLYLPDNMYIDSKNIYTWNDTIPIAGSISSDDTKQFLTQDKETIIEIDAKASDLNLLSMFSGGTELTFGLDCLMDRNYNVTDLPVEFSIPDEIDIDYLCSDALRLCIEENVFNSESVNRFLDSERTIFDSILKSISPNLDVSGKTDRTTFDNSLVWDGNISDMDANTPVKVSTDAHSSYPIKFSVFPPGFDIEEKTFTFSGIQNHNVTYKIIFPNGIRVSTSDEYNKTITDTTDDGRHYILVTFSSNESNMTIDVTCKMTASALFIVSVFLPCIITFIIVIILIVLVLILRKKRGGFRRKRRQKETSTEDELEAVEEEEEEDNTYEGEDYYIPPPPRSRGKSKK